MSPAPSSAVPTQTYFLHGPSATVARFAVLADTPTSTTPSSTVTPTPTCCSTPNAVVIELVTMIQIPDYSRFYQSPIDSFHPTYFALPDGSLITPPLISDVRSANSWLLVYGAIGTFFLLNTFASLRYVRKAFIPKKVLFHLLLCSQMLGAAAAIPAIVPYFNQVANCTAVGIAVEILITLSYSVLISGILGYKAYLCLNRSRVVLGGLMIFRTALLALTGLDISRYRGQRRLSGSCGAIERSKILPIIITLQTVEALFICGSFLVAVWQTSRNPVARGRLSIQLSVAGSDSADSPYKTRRGWWDYVPDGNGGSEQVTIKPIQDPRAKPSLLLSVKDKLQNCCQSYSTSTLVKEKVTAPEHPRNTRTSSVVFAEATSIPDRTSGLRAPPLPSRPHPTSSIARPPSTVSRLSKYMPRLKLLKKVLRDELLYTTFTTAIFLVTAVTMLVGVTGNLFLGPYSWLILNWVLVSTFTMHSFSRVVRRHEQEAILQHPSAWDPMYRAELEASRVFHQDRSRRAFSPVSVVSRRPRRTGTDLSSPAGLYHDLNLHNHASLHSPAYTERPSSLPGPSGSPQIDSRPWQTASQFSRGDSASTYTTSPAASAEHIPLPRHWHDNVLVLPSPNMGDFSALPSANSTPSDSQHINPPLRTETPTSSTLTGLCSKPSPSFDSRSVWEPPDLTPD